MKFSKDKAIALTIKAAKDYAKTLRNVKYLLLCKNYKSNSIDCFEIRFPQYAFQHLTGLCLTENSSIKSASDFFKACLEGKISPKDIFFSDEIYTEKKLQVLSQLIYFVRFSKMSVVFDGGRPILTCDKVVGTTNFCIALNLHDSKYYVPVSCLNEDVRNFGSNIYQVVAIFSANLNDKTFSNIRSAKKGVDLRYFPIPDAYKSVIDLKEYKFNE